MDIEKQLLKYANRFMRPYREHLRKYNITLPEYNMIQMNVHYLGKGSARAGYNIHKDTGVLVSDDATKGFSQKEMTVLTFVFCDIKGLEVKVSWSSKSR